MQDLLTDQDRLTDQDLLTYKGTVYPWHCDHMGHMNVMWYVGKFDEATWQLFHALGLTSAFLRASNRGMAAVEQAIQYKRELLAGDAVTVHSAVIAVKDRSIQFTHVMRKVETDEIAATTTLTVVHLDTVARRAAAFPDAVRARAATMVRSN
jgi:acyl-CoA thioester hydrolase